MDHPLHSEVVIDRMVSAAMRDIIETAAKDGLITDEETALIDLAEESLKLYHRELHLALDDDLITEEERKSLEDLKDAILDKGMEVANLDERITADEMALLMAYIVAIKLPKITK